MQPAKAMNKILVVDDEAMNRKMFLDILGDEYIVKTTESGEDALKMIPAFEPDLMLLDVMLPGMDGYDICRAVRNDPCHKSIKVLMISAIKTEVGERLEGYEAGADDYIAKPFDYDELKHKVRIFLHLKRIEEVDMITGYLLQRFSIEARTPLNGLIHPAESIIQNDLPPNEVKHLAGIMLESANRLYAFVRKITLFCELKKGLTPTLKKEPLSRHLIDIIHEYDDLAKFRSARINMSAPDAILISVDWGMIDRALGFLIENALEHSPPGGTVNITTTLNNGFIQIAISDQGDGVKPELIDKIFDACRSMLNLARLNDTMGFSLAVAKHILDLHNGSIYAFNNPGKGVTFYVTLPVTADP
jgi:two-component system sensor histidine kinase/response regulator